MPGKRLTQLVCILLIALMPTAQASKVDEDQRTHVDLRRTTLVVSDIGRSLEFYRDALGMVVIHDQTISTPLGASLQDADFVRRLVLLRANDDYIGVIGLLEYVKPEKPSVSLKGSAFRTGTSVLVFRTQKLRESLEKARKIRGVVVLDEPELVSYPSYAGEASIRMLVSSLQDPDGFTVELSEVQEEKAQ